MSRTMRLTIGFLALLLLTSGCYGPFQLTRKVHHWNAQAGGKWEQEFLFILLTWVPVYGLASLGDALIFNAVEFWTGRNPVDTSEPRGTHSFTPSSPHQPVGSRVKHLARFQTQADLFYELEPHPSLLIQQSRQGHSSPSLRLEWRDGLAVGSDGNGHVLFTARTLPNGRVLVSDRLDRPVALYSHVQAQRFLQSLQAVGTLAVVSQEESVR